MGGIDNKLEIIYLLLSKSWYVVCSVYETFENNSNDKFILKTNAEENSNLTELPKDATYVYGTIKFMVKQTEAFI